MKFGNDTFKKLFSKDLVDKYNDIIAFITEQVNNNNLEVAEQILNELEKEVIINPEIFSIKSSILFQKGEIDLAIEVLKEGYILFNDNFDLLYNLTYLFLVKGNEDSSQKYLREIYENIILSQEQSNLLNEVISLYEKSIDNVKMNKMVYLTDKINCYSKSLLKLLSEHLSIKVLYVKDAKKEEMAEVLVSSEYIFINCDLEYLFKINSLPLLKERKVVVVYDEVSMSKLDDKFLSEDLEDAIRWENVSAIIVPSVASREILISSIKNVKHLTDIYVIPITKSNIKVNYERKEIKNIGLYGDLSKNEFIITSILYNYLKLNNNYDIKIISTCGNKEKISYLQSIANDLGIQDKLSFVILRDRSRQDIIDNIDLLISTNIEQALDSFVYEFITCGKAVLLRDFLNNREVFNSNLLWKTVDEIINKINNYSNFVEDDYNHLMENISENCNENIVKIERILNKNERNLIEKRALAILNGSYDTNKIEELTILIPSFNRLDILYDDLTKKYKLGNTRKIIADDGTKEDEKLHSISKEKDLYAVDMAYKNKMNLGIAGNLKEMTKKVKTKYCCYMGDDDAQFVKCSENIVKSYNLLDKDYIMLHPKSFFTVSNCFDYPDYGFNYEGNDDMSCEDALRNYFLLKRFIFGMIGICKTEEYLNSLSDNYFSRMSDDVVTLSRLYSQNLTKKIKVVDDWVYIKRIHGNNTSIDLDDERCLQSFIAHAVAGYHCLINNLVSVSEFDNTMKMFYIDCLIGEYKFEYNIYEDFDYYVNKKVSIEKWLEHCKNIGLINDKICIKDLPKELIELPNIYMKLKEDNHS